MTREEKRLMRLSFFVLFGIVGLLARATLVKSSALQPFIHDMEKAKQEVLEYWGDA